MKRVVMVSGAGRSGTSTVSGALTMLGVHVPQPEVPPDESNPRGFFESQWVVDFHKELLNRSPVVRTLDSRPEAMELAATLSTVPDARRLDDWLTDQFQYDQVLVKDPRAFWFHELWRTSVEHLGAELVDLTMLRHPVEVAKSRDTYYLAEETESFRRMRATANIAAWCNVAFLSEQVTRSFPRAYVRYTDLISDWRCTLRPVVERLGLEVDTDLASHDPHPVDDFIDAGLRRSEATWDTVDVPETLKAVAEGTWEQVNRLVEDPLDPSALNSLRRLQADYARLHDHAVAIAIDHTRTREVHVRRKAKANMARDYQERIDELEAQLVEARETGGRWFGRSRARD